MEQLMPMLMMSQMSGKSSNEGNGASETGQMDLMMRMMFPEMFEEEVIPIWSAATAFGTRRRQGQDEIGVLELRIVPPTTTSPRASLRLICGGVPILLRPDELLAVERFFGQLNGQGKQKAMWPDGTIEEGTLQEIWNKATQMEDDKKMERMIGQMARS
jgi:hypothetical protein